MDHGSERRGGRDAGDGGSGPPDRAPSLWGVHIAGGTGALRAGIRPVPLPGNRPAGYRGSAEVFPFQRIYQDGIFQGGREDSEGNSGGGDDPLPGGGGYGGKTGYG